MSNSLNILEQTTMPRLLVFLFENENVNRTILKKSGIGAQDTIYRALRMALDEELVQDTKIGGFGGAIYTSLTPKGRTVAEKLLEIKELLDESKDISAEFVVRHPT